MESSSKRKLDEYVYEIDRTGSVYAKAKRIRSQDVGEIETSETIGDLPVELAHHIMSFTGLKETLNISKTSRTHKALLLHMLNREDREYSFHMRHREYVDGTVWLLDADTILDLDDTGFHVNDVDVDHIQEKEDADEMDDSNVIVISPGRFCFGQEMDEQIYRVEGYSMVLSETRAITDTALATISDAITDETPKRFWNSPYGTVASYGPVDREDIVPLWKGEGDVEKIFPPKWTHYSIIWHPKGVTATLGDVRYASSLDDDTIILFVKMGQDRGRVMLLANSGMLDIIWSMDVGEMEMEASCMIFNRMILFSVRHPSEDVRTVFVIERGPKVKKAFHLSTRSDDRRMIKCMAYERGVAVLLLGPRERESRYDRVMALDMVSGTSKEWHISDYSISTGITMAKGLQFAIGGTYIKVLAL